MAMEISTQTQPRGILLQTFDDAFRFAKMVANSEFAPKDFRGKPESCLLAIQHGSEVGLSPMQSLQSIAVINGRPTIWGDAALALVQTSSQCEYVTETIEGEGRSMVAICEVKRRGYPLPSVTRFAWADAEKAGLAGKSGPWQQYPARMLALRARGFALRNSFADALRGLITAEEAQDYSMTVPEREMPARTRLPAPEPGVVIESRDEPQPVEQQFASQVYTLAFAAIAKASTEAQVAKLNQLVRVRLGESAITTEEADGLLAMCEWRLGSIREVEEGIS